MTSRNSNAADSRAWLDEAAGLVPPLLLVVSGPSGSGKGTALEFIRDTLRIPQVRTYTTRSPRSGEESTGSYNFLSEEELADARRRGDILEWSRPYGGDAYASPSSLATFTPATGPEVVELDPRGFLNVRRRSSRHVVGVFILPGSLEQLRSRVQSRSPVPDIERRMHAARSQLAFAWTYEHLAINDELDHFLEQLSAIVTFETSVAHRIAHLHNLATSET